MIRTGFVVLLFLLVACTPDLREGFYACTSDDECPVSWFCRADQLCYSTADGPSQKQLFEGCSVGPSGDVECMSGLCAPGPDATTDTGQCSTPCTDDASCPGAPNAWCVDGECVGTCASSGDCSSGLGCFRLVSRTGRACFDVSNPTLGSKTSCASSAECDPKTPCLLDPVLAPQGVCSWPCNGSGDSCPLSADCVDASALHGASPTGFACLVRCGASCSSGLTCVKFGGNQKYCVPVGW